MPIYKLQCAWSLDSVNPRDRMVITPHFHTLNPIPELDTLCNDMLTGLQSIQSTAGELSVKAYDAQSAPPNYPEGEAIVNKGLSNATTRPRELAVCLSFYGERNVPRQRGRLYIPTWLCQASTTTLRPTTPLPAMQSLVNLFTGLGGVDVDWCVYSRRNNTHHSVTNWWYDNEWDVMRSRGLVGTTRVTGTTSEAGAAQTVALVPE